MTLELKAVRTRSELPNTFTTAQFRKAAYKNGIEEIYDAIDLLINKGQIKRVAVGHYEIIDRYKNKL